MEDPVTEIASVIKGLTTTPPEHQRHVVETYFLPNGAFDHPLCHVNRFYHPVTSRSLVLAIYRWYKFLSPVINIDIKSIAFDETKGRLYVNCTQVFTFWFIPWHHIIVELVTVLDLEKHKPPNSIDEDTKKWYIAKQNDLYQLEEWVAFFPFILPGARQIVRLLKNLAAFGCLVGATLALWVGFVKEMDEGEVCADCKHFPNGIGKAIRSKGVKDEAQTIVIEQEKLAINHL